MTADEPVPPVLADERVRRDLRATVELNLTTAGVWLGDAQVSALVDAVLARLAGECRARRLGPDTSPGPGPDGVP